MMAVGKSAKSLILIVVWGLAVIALLFTLFQIFNPGERTINQTLYNSQIESAIDYTVRLKSTPVYERAKNADPSKYYLLPFTDYMAIDYNYSVKGSDEANIITNSYVTAFLVSYIDEGNDEIELWKKEYTISENEKKEITASETTDEKRINLELNQFTSLIAQVEDEYNFRSQYYLLIVYTTEFEITHASRTETKILQPKLRINIDDLLYQVDNSGIANASVEFTEQKKISDVINWDYVLISGTLFIILAVFAMLLPTKIINSEPLTKEARSIRQITMKYGDRIVKILDKPVLSDSTVRLESIDYVMKIADEIAQPIFSVSIDKETYYYVNNNGVIYYISLKTK